MLAAGALLVAGCGGDAASSSTPDPSSPVAAASSVNLPSAAVQAEQLVTAPQLTGWVARLHEQWGVMPRLAWSAAKEGDARWRARLVLTGDDPGERLVAEWIIRLPLDRAPTNAEVAHLDDADRLEAANAFARKLSKEPPAVAGRTVKVNGGFLDDFKHHEWLWFTPEASPGAEGDEALRRGDRAIRGATDGLRITPGPATHIRTTKGAPLTIAALRKLIQPGGSPIGATITWELDHTPRGPEDLERAVPVTITVGI